MKKPGGRGSGRVVLDTSAYSRFYTGTTAVADLIGAAEVVAMTSVTLGELEAGYRSGNRYGENRRVLDDFLEGCPVSILDVKRSSAKRYGLLMAELKRLGCPMPTNDVWIAALTLDWGGHLISFDRDFTRVPGLLHTLLA